MNIIFDLEIKYPGFLQRVNPMQLEVLFEIHSFVKQRVEVLKDEIDAEEKTAKGKATVIDLTNKKIVAFKYSEELRNKIVGSFKSNDIEWMWLKVESIIQEWSN